MVRERSKLTNGGRIQLRQPNGTLIWDVPLSQTVKEYFRESSYPGSNNCYHWRINPAQYHFTYSDGKTQTGSALHIFGGGPTLANLLASAIKPLPLNRNKLLSSSQFGLLQAIAELDDTLGIFAIKFWRNLSYGSITWGILPLVSEFQALAQQANNLSKRARDNFQPYEDEFTSELPSTMSFSSGGYSYDYQVSGSCTQRLSGTVTIPELPILEFYDRIGFHPDVATAWDLVPFSFVVDYLLPIGDYLESISNRGWIKVANFTGWSTAKLEGSCTFLGHKVAPTSAERYPAAYYTGAVYDFELFSRSLNTATVIVDEENESSAPSLKLPSFRQLINTAYLAGTRGKR